MDVLFDKITELFIPYIEDEKENYTRSKRYLIRCTILTITLLGIIIFLLIYFTAHPLVLTHSHQYKEIETLKKPQQFHSKYHKLHHPTYNNANDINKDLFCSLKTDKHNNIQNKSYAHFLSNLMRLQYPTNCLDSKNKYFILNHQCNVGLFASIECLAYYFLMSIFMDRTFIITGQWTFGNDKICTKNHQHPFENSMDCFFIPISNCSAEYILFNEYNKPNPSIFEFTHENIIHREQQLDIEIDNQWFYLSPYVDKPGLYERILLMPPKTLGGFGWKRIQKSPIGNALNKWLKIYYGIDRFDYLALIQSYFLRMQYSLQQKVYAITNDTLNVFGDIFEWNNSLTIMINWGWDCKHNVSELYWTCFEYNEYMDAVKELKILQPNLKYVIVTSEEFDIINDIDRDYNKWMKKNNIEYVGVYGDIMHADNRRNAVRKILVAMQLQFASKYHMMSRMEFWEMELFKMKMKLNCTVFNRINDEKFRMDNKGNKEEDIMIYWDGNNDNHYVVWNYKLSKILNHVYHTSEKLKNVYIKNKLTTHK
eukprot:193749_1